MPLPILEKTYYMDVNRQVGHSTNATTACQSALFAIKDGLKTGGCTVWGSSDTVSYGAADYWVDQYDIVAGSAGSWIVLNIPNGGQIMLGAGTLGYSMYMIFSSAGLFTGGDASTFPTASDGYTWFSNTSAFNGSAAWVGRSNVWLSSDGDNLWYILTFSNRYHIFFLFSRLQNPVGNWDGYHVQYCVSQNTDTSYLSTERLGPGGNNNWRVWQSGGHRSGGLTTIGANSGTPLNQDSNYAINSWTGEYEMHRAGFWCESAGYQGRHGRIADFYFVNGVLNNADTLENDPDNPTFDWGVFYEVALPWDGSGAPAMSY